MIKAALGLLVIILLAVAVLGSFGLLLFPLDILNYLPSFSLETWQRPHNSLLADPLYQFEPWRHYAKEQILSGRIPLWNDLNGGGAPFLANPQTAVFYPLNFLYYIFPLQIALNIIPLLKLFLMALFTCLYLISLRISKGAAFLGSFLSVFAGFPIMWLLWPHTNVFILFPILLYLTEKLRETKFSHRILAAICITYFIGVLGGHPETLFHIGLLHFVYSFFRLSKKLFFNQLLFIILGFLLAGFLLLPFLEYLLSSSLIANRFQDSPGYYLPVKGFIYNFFPLILGGPHLTYYKQLSEGVNFQELSGGFVGAVVILITAFGSIRFWSIPMVRFICLLLVVLLGIVYKIWPFFLFTELPLINAVANHRFIGFIGFFVVILFALVIDRLSNKPFPRFIYNRTFIVLIVSVLFSFPLLLIVKNVAGHLFPEQAEMYIPFLLKNIIFYFYTTVILLGLYFFFHMRKMRRLNFVVLFLAVFLQSTFLFAGYNSVQKASSYYPQTELVKELKKLPKGTMLEVGNPNFPPNLNLIYGIKSAESDDAVNVSSYKKAFDKAFPNKNRWKKVDEVSLASLQKFGIKYIVSDHDINLDKVSVQGDMEEVLSALTGNRTYNIPFTAKSTGLGQIRILTANHNRFNDCIVKIVIVDSKENYVSGNEIDCRNVRDSMFYAVDFKNTELKKGEKYKVSISSKNSSKSNSISLWGNKGGVPYLETLYRNNDRKYELLWNRKSVYLWRVIGVNYISFLGQAKIINESVERTIIKTESQKPGLLEIKRTNFPGWKATIDGREIKIVSSNPFMKVNIPAASHIINIFYAPTSLHLGIIVSIVSFIFILVYFLRLELQETWYISLVQSYSKKVKKLSPGNIIYIAVWLWSFLIIGILMYGFISLLLPQRLPLPFSTTQNWLKLNAHSLQLDNIRVLLLGMCIFVSLLSGWLIYLWKKR